jgi:hypothetical protein
MDLGPLSSYTPQDQQHNNPLLDHIDQAFTAMHPLAQQAVANATPVVQQHNLALTGNPGTETGAGYPRTSEQPLAAPAVVPAAAPTKLATTAPTPTDASLAAAQQEQHRLVNSGSGVSQIHNPFLRGLATVGDVASAFFPRISQTIPGTTMHHNVLVRQAGQNVNALEAQENEEHRRAQEDAQASAVPFENEYRTAQTGEANARAYSLMHPQPKENESGKTVDTDQGIMQLNPKTNRYDILVGKKPGTKETGTVHQLDDGSLVIAHPDGTATAVTLNGKPVKGEAKTPPRVSPEDQAIEEDQKAHPGETTAEAIAHVKRTTERPEKPEDKGENYEVNNTLVRVHPGQEIPVGAKRTNVAASEQLASDKSDTAVKKAREDAASDYKLAQQFAAHPSPTNDVALVMHYIGATKPESLGKLRLNNNEMNLVLGTRSSFGDLQAFAQKVINGQKLTPTQRSDMLETMKTISDSHGEATAASAPPKAGAVENGYRFKGGNPGDKANWEKVQ